MGEVGRENHNQSNVVLRLLQDPGVVKRFADPMLLDERCRHLTTSDHINASNGVFECDEWS